MRGPIGDRAVAHTPRYTAGTSHPYEVTGADGDGPAVQTEPHVNQLLHDVPNGATLHVVCPTNHGDR
ncbi:hypothetical protein [Actinoallomurus sp. NPDC052274]|uniref:hypothetical protein n=1 Tax=Actinoallomurus sp. NPDC052274 TaxID=3155420 RepID=UPI0034405FD2